MKKYQLFACIIAALLFAYGVFNFVVWHLCVGQLLNDPQCPGGDLTRLGYITGSKMRRQQVNDLPLRHMELAQYQGGAVDVVTIGDSFSQGGGYGRNSFYQDYLASLNNFRVLNLPQYNDLDKVSTLSILNNNGYLERIRPKYVLIECAEKKCLDDLPPVFDFDRTIAESELGSLPKVEYQQSQPQSPPLINLDFFNEANYKFVRNEILYRFSDHAYLSQVYKAKLDRAFFSVPNADTLLFYKADVKNRNKTPENIARLNEALNTLQDRLSRRGIELYFMPCVDKYNLYSGHIVNNKHPRSMFFEQLRTLPKRYHFIDTKSLLLEELEKGEKDLYYADDTHWSWKASEKIFKSVRFPAR